MTSTVPDELAMVIAPSGPTPAVTRLATVWSRTSLRLEAFGVGLPFGYTVRNPAVVGLVTVTFRATALTSLSGTSPRARMAMLRLSP